MSSEEIIIPVLGILLPIILTLGAYIMVVFLRKYQNIERMAMIEKGVSRLVSVDLGAAETLLAAE